ncbi:MAG: bile acid:sodium symporter family protein [Spirochaetota bacterium]
MNLLLKYAKFIRTNYQSIIIFAVVSGLIIGIWTSTPGQWLQKYSSLLMFLMIYFMSFPIDAKEFGIVVSKPGGVIAGLLYNFAIMPLLCVAIAKVFIHNNMLATGVILIGVVPCAGMSAVWTGLLEGDVPLSLGIDAVTIIISPFLIPYLMKLFAGSYVAIDILKMFKHLVVLLLIPVISGIITRYVVFRVSNPKKVMSITPAFPALSATTAIFLMFSICNSATPMIIKQSKMIPSLIASVILIFPIAFIGAYYTSKLFFNYKQVIAVTYTSGMKNLPIAMGIALVSFPKLVGLPIALSFIFQMLTASIFYRIVLSQMKDK